MAHAQSNFYGKFITKITNQNIININNIVWIQKQVNAQHDTKYTEDIQFNLMQFLHFTAANLIIAINAAFEF